MLSNGMYVLTSRSGESYGVATVTWVSQAYNIARTVESCLAALEGIDGEVILADSLSEDATVEVARQYPIKIMQLVNKYDRGCGAAAQLGYQHSTGNYVYLIDGDIVLHRDFLRNAYDAL